MASITSSEYVTKTNVEAPVLFLRRLKNYKSDTEASEAFETLKLCYTIMLGDTEVQADGTAFQADLGNGKSVMIELNYDEVN